MKIFLNMNFIPLLENAKYCFVRTFKAFQLGKRSQIPLQKEISYIENRKKYPIAINFLLGNHIIIGVESYSIAEDACEICLERLGLNSIENKKNFALFVVKWRNHEIVCEYFLGDHEKVLDIFTQYYNEKRNLFKNNHNQENVVEFKIFLKLRVFSLVS